MTHEFDAGYNKQPFKRLCENYPEADVYVPEDFRVEWGPIFHRGRLDGSARVLVIGQDPAAHECIARRILVGEAGQRVQGLLAKLGIETSYVMINTFLYSVYGQGGGTRHIEDPLIAAYRNEWLDALIDENRTEAVIAFGQLADAAFGQWLLTPNGKAFHGAYQPLRHPTYPESASASGNITKAQAMKNLLDDWNHGLTALHKAIEHPDVERRLKHYDDNLADDDVVSIPKRDLPAGLPEWMLSLKAWANRSGESENEKRATIQVRVPTEYRNWNQNYLSNKDLSNKDLSNKE